MNLAGTRAMLAIELYRAERGRYPDSLAVVVPEYLDDVPEDPYTGKPLRYSRLEPTEDGYVLYSVGLDGVDDGGKVHPMLAAAACSPKGSG